MIVVPKKVLAGTTVWSQMALPEIRGMEAEFVPKFESFSRFIQKQIQLWLYHPLPDRTKVADLSGWMIKPVGPNSSSKCQLYCENNQIR